MATTRIKLDLVDFQHLIPFQSPRVEDLTLTYTRILSITVFEYCEIWKSRNLRTINCLISRFFSFFFWGELSINKKFLSEKIFCFFLGGGVFRPNLVAAMLYVFTSCLFFLLFFANFFLSFYSYLTYFFLKLIDVLNGSELNTWKNI